MFDQDVFQKQYITTTVPKVFQTNVFQQNIFQKATDTTKKQTSVFQQGVFQPDVFQAPTALNKAVYDTIGITDSENHRFGFVKTASDSIGISESTFSGKGKTV